MEFDLVQRFGIRIHEVEGLAETAVYVPECDLAFVRAGLDPDCRARTASWLLSEALSELASPDRP